LVQSQQHDVAHGNDADACGFEYSTRRLAIDKQKVCHPATVDGEHAAAFDRDSRAAECLAHVGERARPVVELYR
jgi:hypothetical protein